MGSHSKEGAGARDHNGANPGKIFVGGLHKDTNMATFTKHFGKYGNIADSVIIKDKYTNQPRGFGFITYSSPSVVDKVIEDTHIIDGKQVEIKRTIPRGSTQSQGFKTSKIFVGGILPTLTEEEFRSFFSRYGTVVDHQIIRDHETNRSRGFGFIVFDSEQVVDDLVAKGNLIDLAGTKVEIKKAEPKKAPNARPPAFGSESRARSFCDDFGGSYSNFERGGFGPASYRTSGGFGGMIGGYGGEFGGEYGGGFSGGFGSYSGGSSVGYFSRFGSYGGGFGEGYGGSLGGYARGVDMGFDGYGGGYDSAFGSGYDSVAPYGNRGGYGSSGAGRYHPYAR
ncbi:heterogeneous nuclear ribonucleoprotein 1-like [Ananas comosus]|uniref:Heterogeneous nuclear ribonucleoprotein 1-like n=1 Tax=Ananas comosus TaxID=4615 RepID=A0A6P5H396_ANACO|nr:heterogeneous nuclear ribonucleoprotein 1-like [Ananas comosus]XP_020114458.1 heterogeneous nuclear ribonucleoprotein 1-like [Ananas comosus]